MEDDSYSKGRDSTGRPNPENDVDVLIPGDDSNDGMIPITPENLEQVQERMEQVERTVFGRVLHPRTPRQKLSDYFLVFRAHHEDGERTVVSVKYLFSGIRDLKEISAEAFARDAGWTIPEDKEDRRFWLDELKRHPERSRTIEDVELLLYAALKEVLSVFDTTKPANPIFEHRLPDFWALVYPFIRKIRADLSLPGDSVSEVWKDWSHSVGICRQHGTVLASDQDGTEICMDDALATVKRMFSALFRELHPMRIECRLLFEEIEDMLQMAPNRSERLTTGGYGSFFTQPTKPSLQFTFSAAVRAAVQSRLPLLKEVAEKEQPVEQDLDRLEVSLNALVDELKKSDAPDRKEAVERVKFALSIFRETRGRVYPLEVFSFPELGRIDHASLTPSDALERSRAWLAGKTDTTNLPPIPPTLTAVELADFINHFTLGDGLNIFPTRNELDTFTEGVVNESVCHADSGRGKSLAAFFRENQPCRPEVVFKLCKALLELDEERHSDDPPESSLDPSFPDFGDSERRREATRLRIRLRRHVQSAEARAVERAEKQIVERAEAAIKEEAQKRKLKEFGLEGAPPCVDPNALAKARHSAHPTSRVPLPEPVRLSRPSAPSVSAPPTHDPYLQVMKSMDKKLGQLVSGVAGTRQAAESIDSSQRQSAEQAHADQERNLQAIQSLVPEPANFGNGAVDPRSDSEIIDARKWETFQAWRIQYREKKGEKEAERFSKFLIWVDSTLQGQQRSNIASSISRDDFHRFWERDRVQKSRQGI